MEIAPITVLSPRWAKGPARIEGDEIVLDEDRAKAYGFETPEDSERMAFELAALPWRQRDERKVVSFARRYGLLWHGWDDVGSGECRESLEDWWREAARLWFVGAFYEALMDSKSEGSATKIQNFLRQFGYGFPSLPPTRKDFDELYLRGASFIFRDLINEGLNAGPNQDPQARGRKRRCWWGLETVGPGEFQLAQFPPDLLSRAYAAFSVLIGNRIKTRSCRVCGKLFRPTPRQKGEVCSESCGNTLRSWRKRKDPRADRW